MKILLSIMMIAGALLLPAHAAMTESEEQAILAKHNELRDSLGVGEPHLVWNSVLAGVAQTYANKCNWGHNGNRNAESKDSGFTNVGENLYMTTASTVDVKNVVQAWFNEKPDYNYNSKTCAAGKMCGHYTQVVWKDTKEVGCGMTVCNPLKVLNKKAVFVVCNYGPAGNWVGQAPYELKKKSNLEVLLQMLLDRREEAVIEDVGVDAVPHEEDSEESAKSQSETDSSIDLEKLLARIQGHGRHPHYE